MGLYEIGKAYRAKRNENLVVLFWAVVLIFFMGLSQVHCQEYQYVDAKDLPIEVATPTPSDTDTVRALCVGTGLLFAPLPFTNKDLSLGHSLELEGFSYAATDVGYRFFPKDLKWLSPVLVLLLDFGYRSEQFGKGNDDLAWRKFCCDVLGVVARVTITL